MRKFIARRMLRATAKRYGYDTSYLEMMLKRIAGGLLQIRARDEGLRHREVVPVEASFAAKITGALAEDCGPCTQLTVDMALEAGMAKDQIEAVLRRDVGAMNAADRARLPLCRRRRPPLGGRRTSIATPFAPAGAKRA